MHMAQFVLSLVTFGLYEGMSFLGQKDTHPQTCLFVINVLGMNWREDLGFPLRQGVGGI